MTAMSFLVFDICSPPMSGFSLESRVGARHPSLKPVLFDTIHREWRYIMLDARTHRPLWNSVAHQPVPLLQRCHTKFRLLGVDAGNTRCTWSPDSPQSDANSPPSTARYSLSTG